ncbi:MAG: hypothetical protein BYD32DRAFT_375690, partial [Podila humilis]
HTRTMSNPQPNPLSYRKPSTPSSTSSSTFASTTNASNKSKPLSETRIYVGNLDPTIDEYTVLKLFTPFGKITKLDFMFHWHGPKKGTPRGYCFLEFETADQATKAVLQMNRKAIKMRPLNVSLANLVIHLWTHRRFFLCVCVRFDFSGMLIDIPYF